MTRQREDRLTVFLDLLSDPGRRRLLYLLEEHETAEFDRLADVLTGWSLTRDGQAVARRAEHERARAALRHSHLPRLVDAGVIRVDEGQEQVTLAEVEPMFEDLLSMVRGLEGPTQPTAAGVGHDGPPA